MEIVNVPIPTPSDVSHIEVMMYVGGLVVSAFIAGAAIRAKLNTAFNNAIKGVEDDMNTLTARVDIIEKNYVTKQDAEKAKQATETGLDRLKEFHDKDMDKMFSLVADIREDLKEGFNSLGKRIDSLYALRVKNTE